MIIVPFLEGDWLEMLQLAHGITFYRRVRKFAAKMDVK